MLTRFEHFAVTELMGKPETPPRENGTLCFSHEWERTAFGIALALARQGHFEWDDFRASLINEIGAWEAAHPDDRSSWNYYELWLAALEKSVAAAGLADAAPSTTALFEA
ncbi:nitrile hydratase accessory protein [Bosea sp. 685]|uniref:nitrile hydratase accessory protein n=1 Tax=Bosea sp. 685 TaxID=3080057 RepID=UPI00289352AC|nr:nitrile hydratase accessory protein [Bosea sp. 685]WNJ87924.1 nitrile hydratase accessory protein [Bosea sp. 685]